MSGTWTQVEIAGKKAEIFEPAVRPRFGLLFLHGVMLQMLHDKPAYTRLLDQHNLACICPHGQRAWWGDKVSKDFDDKLTTERWLLDSVVPYFNERWGLRPPAIGLFGISMGGQGALRLAFKHPKVFPIVAALAAAVDYHEWHGQGYTLDDMYDSKEQCRQDTAVMWVPPYNAPPHLYFAIDPDDADWVRGNDRLHEKLAALGVAHTIDFTTRAGGHTWDYFNHMAEPVIRFLLQGLEQESRRLL